MAHYAQDKSHCPSRSQMFPWKRETPSPNPWKDLVDGSNVEDSPVECDSGRIGRPGAEVFAGRVLMPNDSRAGRGAGRSECARVRIEPAIVDARGRALDRGCSLATGSAGDGRARLLASRSPDLRQRGV